MTAPRQTSRPTLYEHAGGEEALHRLEQTFYDSVLADRCHSPCSGRDGPGTSIT